MQDIKYMKKKFIEPIWDTVGYTQWENINYNRKLLVTEPYRQLINQYLLIKNLIIKFLQLLNFPSEYWCVFEVFPFPYDIFS